MEPREVLTIIYASLTRAGVPCELQLEEHDWDSRIVLYPDAKDEGQPWCIDAASLTELRHEAL